MTDIPPGGTPRPQAPWWWPQMRDVLALLSTAIFASAFVIPVVVKGSAVDADLKGAIMIQWGAVMGWYFGSSKGGVAKDATIATALNSRSLPTLSVEPLPSVAAEEQQ